MTTDLLLPGTTTMDAVTLHVADLPGMTDYYRDALGLEELPGDAARTAVDRGSPAVGRADTSVLGRGRDALVVLVHTPGLPAPAPGQAGLFHTALLFPDRAALADVVARAGQHPARSSSAPPTTWSRRRSTSPIPRATASSSTGTGRASSGAGTAAGWPWTPSPWTRRRSCATTTWSRPPAPPRWATCTSRSATSPPRGPSTSTPSASRSPPSGTARSSSRPVATTTTWP